MAQSPAHQFGQIIGDVIEAAVEPLLAKFAQRHGLYLDRKGPRAARKGKSVSWTDMYGNTHELDFVLERGGSDNQAGTPVAFIETAWRRYTKHSRNKAQEIQGAILPLVATHKNSAPFIGVILAGVFTDGALNQLRSLGFSVLFLPYDTVVAAFRTHGIEAEFGERTPDIDFRRRVKAWRKLSRTKRADLAAGLLAANTERVGVFMQALERAVTRRIETVQVAPLHGRSFELHSVDEAMAFIERYSEGEDSMPIRKYEITVRYTNGDRVDGSFSDKASALEFLRGYQQPRFRPVT